MNTTKNNVHRTFVLLLSWRDIRSPKAGGAEVFTHEMLRNADQGRYSFIHFSCAVAGLPEREIIDGVHYIRQGNALTVIAAARRFYHDHEDNIDYVIDQCNTHQFFTPFWVPRAKRIFFIHQLTREIWFRQMKLPFSLAGFLAETPMLALHSADRTFTVSDSTADDLRAVGFRSGNITILPEGLPFKAWSPDCWLPKDERKAFIYVGRYSRYKGIDTAIEAFAEARKSVGSSVLWLVGKPDPEYIAKKLEPLCKQLGLRIGEAEDCDVVVKGFVTHEQKLELMSRARSLIFPSLREGWGLTVSESAAVGTPSIVFDSPGTRDAVDQGRAGYMCRERTSSEIARLMINSAEDSRDYQNMRIRAYSFASKLHWERTGMDFTWFLDSITYSMEDQSWKRA